MKQLFNFFSVTNIQQKSCRVSVPVMIYNSLVSPLHIFEVMLSWKFKVFKGCIHVYRLNHSHLGFKSLQNMVVGENKKTSLNKFKFNILTYLSNSILSGKCASGVNRPFTNRNRNKLAIFEYLSFIIKLFKVLLFLKFLAWWC